MCTKSHHCTWVSFSFIHSPRLHLCQFLYHFTLLIYLDITSCILVLFQLSFLNIVLQSTQFLSKKKYYLLKRKNLSSIMERTLFNPKKIEKKYSKIPANDEVLSTFLLWVHLSFENPEKLKLTFYFSARWAKKTWNEKVDPYLSGNDVTNFYYVEVGKCTKVRYYFLSGQNCENYILVRYMYTRNPNPKLEIGFEYSVLCCIGSIESKFIWTFLLYLKQQYYSCCHFVPYSYKEFLITIKNVSSLEKCILRNIVYHLERREIGSSNCIYFIELYWDII